MTHFIRANHTFEPQTSQSTSLLEGPIRDIPIEIVGCILFLTKHSESIRLVSREWNVLTFTVAKNSNNHELKQTIRLVTEKLKPDEYSRCIADLAELQDAYQIISGYVTTFAEVQRSLLVAKSWVICILRKLPEEDRDQLQEAIGNQLPDSMKDLFGISKLNLEDIENLDLDAFFSLLQSYQPLSIDDRGRAVSRAAWINNRVFVKLLLTNGPISVEERGQAVCYAASWDNSVAGLLLANGPISIWYRGNAVMQATKQNNIELVRLLLANGPISEKHRGFAINEADAQNNIELIRLLMTRELIPEEDGGMEVWKPAENNNQKLVQRVRKPSIKSKITAGVAALVSYTWHSSKNTKKAL